MVRQRHRRSGPSKGDCGMGEGLFHNLMTEEQVSLVEYARRELNAAKERDKMTYARLLAYRAEKRREFLVKAEVNPFLQTGPHPTWTAPTRSRWRLRRALRSLTRSAA